MTVYTELNSVRVSHRSCDSTRCLSEQEHMSEQLQWSSSIHELFASLIEKRSTSNNFSCAILTDAQARSIMQASECKRLLHLNHSSRVLPEEQVSSGRFPCSLYYLIDWHRPIDPISRFLFAWSAWTFGLGEGPNWPLWIRTSVVAWVGIMPKNVP